MNEKTLLEFMDGINESINQLNTNHALLNETLTAYRQKNDTAVDKLKEGHAQHSDRLETLQSQVAVFNAKMKT